MAREPEDGDERREQQQLVGDRVEQLPQLAHFVAAAGEVAVHHVRGARREEDHERDDLGPVALNEGKQRDDRREADAREGEDVGQGPPHRTVPLAQRLQYHLADQLEGVEHAVAARSEEHTSELQSQSNLVCRLLLEKKKKYTKM